MKTNLILLLSLVFLFACNDTNQKNESNKESGAEATTPIALLIDGEWEADYIMNAPKSFAELYSNVKPGMNLNSTSGKVSGSTGCNSFTGTVVIVDNNIHFDGNMATTRKMCADMAGEILFLETLKKINRYSVTDTGKTLNLIMGDIAVMRLRRK